MEPPFALLEIELELENLGTSYKYNVDKCDIAHGTSGDNKHVDI